MRKLIVIILCATQLCFFIKAKAGKGPDYALQVHPAIQALTMVMIHDVVNPPAAARYYAYCSMAAYNIVAAHNTGIQPLASFVKSYKDAPIPACALYDYRIAAVYSIMEAGRQLLPSGYMLQDDEEKYVDILKKAGIKDTVIRASIKVAENGVQKIVAYAKGDHYNKLSTFLRYTPKKGDSSWYPTPPAYMEAVEPHWNTIRPFVIDSASEYVPERPVAFSKDTASDFFKLATEVYQITGKLTEEQANIANFWDCNPFAITTSGHMMIGFKKISPGGHWMNITGIAAKKAKLGFDNTILLHAATGITLMDAFISCWDEKYRSNRIRPETFIVRYIDAKWRPLLQTPPFPENTSGHSVISAAAAEVLTYFLGDNFTYTDDSEEMFEIPARKFASFRKASAEAAISRLYGGIHFRDSIENGQKEGKQVAGKVIAALVAAGIKPLVK